MKENTNKAIKPDYEPDYEDLFTVLSWDLDKAKYLLLDVWSFFETSDPEYPPREKIENIKYEYKHILVMLGLLTDLVEKMTDKINPLT